MEEPGSYWLNPYFSLRIENMIITSSPALLPEGEGGNKNIELLKSLLQGEKGFRDEGLMKYLG